MVSFDITGRSRCSKKHAITVACEPSVETKLGLGIRGTGGKGGVGEGEWRLDGGFLQGRILRSGSFSAQKSEFLKDVIDHAQLGIRLRQRLLRFAELVDGFRNADVGFIDLDVAWHGNNAFLSFIEFLLVAKRLTNSFPWYKVHVGSKRCL